MSHRNRGRRASAAVLAGLIASTAIAARAQTAPSPTKAISPAAQISIGAADIGGVVASAQGPEAGVWVIAETTDLPTKFAKIVVTDDAGRYLIPDLPKANYKVWVRGYGLVDSPASGCDARPKPRFGRDHCAVGGGGREILSRDVLVFDAPYPCSGPISGHRRNRQRNSALPEDSRRLDRYDQKLLPIMPCARQREHSRAARDRTRRFPIFQQGSPGHHRSRQSPASAL